MDEGNPRTPGTVLEHPRAHDLWLSLRAEEWRKYDNFYIDLQIKSPIFGIWHVYRPYGAHMNFVVRAPLMLVLGQRFDKDELLAYLKAAE